MAKPYRLHPYKVVDRETASPHVLIAKGELNVRDKSLITSVLRRLGMSTVFMTEEAWSESIRNRQVQIVQAPNVEAPVPEESQFKFGSIRSMDDFLVREHLEDFNQTMHPEIKKGTLTRIFHKLVDGNGSRDFRWWDQESRRKIYREPVPLAGIVLKSREELDIAPYSKPMAGDYERAMVLAGYAIQVGSLIDVTKPLLTEVPLTTSSEIQIMVASQLEAQIAGQV